MRDRRENVIMINVGATMNRRNCYSCMMTTLLLLFAIITIGAYGENDGRSAETARVVRRRHLDVATRTAESNDIDDRQATGMALTEAERFELTAAAATRARTPSPGTASLAPFDGSGPDGAGKPDRTVAAAASPATDEETSRSQYYYEYVGPTKSVPGEARRASSSRGRSLAPTEPSTAQPPRQHRQTDATPRTRKAGNSEMEDLMDGFVKLLNGEPVQSTHNRQPMIKTRINNRGPPRISEAAVPVEPPTFVPMPQHQQVKPKDPPPYPFDVPPPVRPALPPQPQNIVRPYLTGVPLPEQLVPVVGGAAGHSADVSVPPPLQYDEGDDHHDHDHHDHHHHQHRPQSTADDATSRRPVYQTAKPQQEYDLFASQIENVTEKFAPPPPPTTTRPEGTATEKPISTEKPSAPTVARPDINATRVIGSQASSKIVVVDHHQQQQQLTSHATPAAGENSTAAASATMASPANAGTETPAGPPDATQQPAGEQEVTGVGSAVVVLEPSTSEEPPHREDVHKPTENGRLQTGRPTTTTTTPVKKTPQQSDGFPYYSRPGIVLDDPEFKPHLGGQRRPIQVQVPSKGDVFDIMVSAIQGPPGDKPGALLTPEELAPSGVGKGEVSVITSAEPNQQFVSIDGKRTYINLFGSPEPTAVAPPSVKPSSAASGSYSVSQVLQPHGAGQSGPPPAPSNAKPSIPPAWKRPTNPPVRIDTCIVGDDSTCDETQHERCRTELGVSSCLCRPGYSRRKHRDPCHRIVSIVFSLRVDRLYDSKITWTDKFKDTDSQDYQQLEHEAARAIDSAFSMTPFSDTFVGVRINNVYVSKTAPGSPTMVNATVQLTESAEHLRSSVKQDIQKQLTGALQRRNNNVGASGLWVDTPAGAISQLHDLDECSAPELNDCHPLGKCTNVFGTFQCACPDGYRDPWIGNAQRSGRTCETCDPGQCNLRGECFFQAGQPVCKCSGSFYGAQCEIDGEVLSVAVGSSVAAISIIVLTLVCLCAWSRRWNREQKIGGSPVFGYMPTGGSTVKTPVIGGPPYQVSIEDRVRWAQIADAMAHANHYAPEPGNGTMRSNNMFGYAGAPMPLPRLRPPGTSTISHAFRTPESSTSEEEDRTDLLGRSFQTSRPKSRSSLANQSGIYYDVDYEQQQGGGEMFSPGCIPLSTYTIGNRSNYYR